MSLKESTGARLLNLGLTFVLDYDILSAIRAGVVLHLARDIPGTEKHAAVKAIAEAVISKVDGRKVRDLLLEIAIRVVYYLVSSRS